MRVGGSRGEVQIGVDDERRERAYLSLGIVRGGDADYHNGAVRKLRSGRAVRKSQEAEEVASHTILVSAHGKDSIICYLPDLRYKCAEMVPSVVS